MKMKKVLLLGDSIRMGYDDFVKELLDGKCEVYYDAKNNGRFSSFTLWQMNQFFRNYGHFDVVHWNNGYWDMNIEPPMSEPIHPIDEYLHFLGRILAEIRKNGARPIFATTTPIDDFIIGKDNTGTGADLTLKNEWVLKYNAVATAFMKSENVPINDLYTLCLEDAHFYKCDDLLHLTEKGYRRCAEQIAECILKEFEF